MPLQEFQVAWKLFWISFCSKPNSGSFKFSVVLSLCAKKPLKSVLFSFGTSLAHANLKVKRIYLAWNYTENTANLIIIKLFCLNIKTFLESVHVILDCPMPNHSITPHHYGELFFSGNGSILVERCFSGTAYRNFDKYQCRNNVWTEVTTDNCENLGKNTCT